MATPTNSVILAGSNNQINASESCTIINGSNNVIKGATNVHVIGDSIQVLGADATNGSSLNDNKFYIGCENGLHCSGPIYCEQDLVVDGDCYIGGHVEAAGDIIAFYSSDERLKKDITPIKGCLQKVLSLDAIEFEWDTDLQKIYKGKDIGLIAQQVEKIAPEIVTKRDDGFLAMKYEKIIPLLVGATQEQDQQISKLEKQVQEIIDKSNH